MNCNERFYNPSLTKLIIFNCFFSFFSSIEGGGAIYLCNINLNFICNETSFYHCETINGNGGAIFIDFTNNNENVFLNKICGNNCSTYTSTYHSPFVMSYVNEFKKNYFSYVSISDCNPKDYLGNTLSLQRFGIQSTLYLNISNNFLNQFSGLCSYGHNILENKFSIIVNNNSTFRINAGFQIINSITPILEYHIYIKNLVGNINPEYGILTFWNGNWNIKNSIFKNNNRILFSHHHSLYSININNCYLFHLETISTGNININSLLSTDFFKISNQFNCYQFFPSQKQNIFYLNFLLFSEILFK